MGRRPPTPEQPVGRGIYNASNPMHACVTRSLMGTCVGLVSQFTDNFSPTPAALAEALGDQDRRSGRRALILVRTPGDQCTTGSPSGTGRPAASTRFPSS